MADLRDDEIEDLFWGDPDDFGPHTPPAVLPPKAPPTPQFLCDLSSDGSNVDEDEVCHSDRESMPAEAASFAGIDLMADCESEPDLQESELGLVSQGTHQYNKQGVDLLSDDEPEPVGGQDLTALCTIPTSATGSVTKQPMTAKTRPGGESFGSGRHGSTVEQHRLAGLLTCLHLCICVCVRVCVCGV